MVEGPLWPQVKKQLGMPGGTRKRFTIAEKKALLARISSGALHKTLMLEDPSLNARVLGRIMEQQEQLDAKDAVDRRGRVLKTMNLGQSGPKPSMPFHQELVNLCMRIREQGKCVSTIHMLKYIRRAHPQWLKDYIDCRVAKKRANGHADALPPFAAHWPI